MTAPSDLLLMLLADARLPTAGHTQSASLEPAVADGIAAAQVPEYMELRLATVTRVEAATAVVALHAIRQGESLAEVEAAWAARTPSAAMRSASRQMGRALGRLTENLWPESMAFGTGTPRAIVLAGAANAGGLSPLALARLVAYDDLQTVASAALKLLPLDPTHTVRWVFEALPSADRLAVDVAPLTSPAEIPAASAPQIEVWAETHAVATRRLFSA